MSNILSPTNFFILSSPGYIPIKLLPFLYLIAKFLNSSKILKSGTALCIIPNAIVIGVATQGVNAKLTLVSVSSSSKNEGRCLIYSLLFNHLNNLDCSDFGAKMKILLLLSF